MNAKLLLRTRLAIVEDLRNGPLDTQQLANRQRLADDEMQSLLMDLEADGVVSRVQPTPARRERWIGP